MQQLFIDGNRCIGCRACVEACSECPGHGGFSMIHLDDLERATTVQTSPTVCMHCDDPACASVCPADAIKTDAAGVVLSASVERCIGCGSCALACPFGVPKIDARRELMMKCDLCYDRTSEGLAPMCATVCPSGALFYGTREEVQDRRLARPLDVFAFGDRVVSTRNAVMAPVPVARVEVGVWQVPARSRAELQLEEALCD
ncbi:MAG: 4Fe-4S dicluster domain-containing protein [Deltaproteobacteria bacterium]|nr:4Fe-4S dicluster domain-containing protein [Deltaproteobacteria bacterium]